MSWGPQCLVDHKFKTAGLSDVPQMELPSSISLHSRVSDFQSMSLQIWGTGKEKGEKNWTFIRSLQLELLQQAHIKSLLGSYSFECCDRMEQNVRNLPYPSFNPDTGVLIGSPSAVMITTEKDVLY